MVIDHFEQKINKNKLKYIIISLPMHLDIESHLASKHNWVCSDKTFVDDSLKKSLEENNLKIFNPTLGFSEIKKNYQLTIKNKIGVYVLEKQ
jgi:flagellar basal body rod protein FlgB